MTPRKPSRKRSWKVWVVTHNGRPAMHSEPDPVGMFAKQARHLSAFLSEEIERATLTIIGPPRPRTKNLRQSTKETR